MSDFLAVDIALLPPKSIMSDVVELMNYSPTSPIKLNTHDCLPHISLAMGVLARADLEKANSVLTLLARKQEPLPISITKAFTHTTPDELDMQELLISRSEELSQFHHETMEAFRPLLLHDQVSTDMFFSPPGVADVSSYWVKHYYGKQKPSDYKPHITLGLGKVKNFDTALNFIADRLVLCHLGSYCTCRQILVEASLS